MNEDELTKLAEMLASDNRQKEAMINKLIELVERSEDRIDKTNSMVREMSIMVERAATLTADHIKQLRTCLNTSVDNQRKLIEELNTTHRLLEFCARNSAPNVQINGPK